MSDEDRCRNGSQECIFDNEREQALVSELMRVIESYCKTEDIDICPLCLRDTMLAIAALLHIEAAKIGSRGMDRPPRCTKKLSDALARSARNALEDVFSAKAALVSSRSKH
jgi:hypothetical protein